MKKSPALQQKMSQALTMESLEKEAKEMQLRLLELKSISVDSKAKLEQSSSNWSSSSLNKGGVTTYLKDLKAQSKITNKMKDTPVKSIKDMKYQYVINWLSSINMAQYVDKFITNDISEEVLPDLTLSDLDYMGISILGHRKVIMKAVDKLNGIDTPKNQSTIVNDNNLSDSSSMVHWSTIPPLSETKMEINPNKSPYIHSNNDIDNNDDLNDDDDDILDEEAERKAFQAAVMEWRNSGNNHKVSIIHEDPNHCSNQIKSNKSVVVNTLSSSTTATTHNKSYAATLSSSCSSSSSLPQILRQSVEKARFYHMNDDDNNDTDIHNSHDMEEGKDSQPIYREEEKGDKSDRKDSGGGLWMNPFSSLTTTTNTNSYTDGDSIENNNPNIKIRDEYDESNSGDHKSESALLPIPPRHSGEKKLDLHDGHSNNEQYTHSDELEHLEFQRAVESWRYSQQQSSSLSSIQVHTTSSSTTTAAAVVGMKIKPPISIRTERIVDELSKALDEELYQTQEKWEKMKHEELLKYHTIQQQQQLQMREQEKYLLSMSSSVMNLEGDQASHEEEKEKEYMKKIAATRDRYKQNESKNTDDDKEDTLSHKHEIKERSSIRDKDTAEIISKFTEVSSKSSITITCTVLDSTPLDHTQDTESICTYNVIEVD